MRAALSAGRACLGERPRLCHSARLCLFRERFYDLGIVAELHTMLIVAKQFILIDAQP